MQLVNILKRVLKYSVYATILINTLKFVIDQLESIELSNKNLVDDKS